MILLELAEEVAAEVIVELAVVEVMAADEVDEASSTVAVATGATGC